MSDKVINNIKEKVFENINTKEKAYWLGFLAADGHIPLKSNSIRLMLSIKDENLLDKFIKFVGGKSESKKYYIGSFKTKRVFFQVSNKKLSNCIKKLGIVSPKGKNLKLLELSSDSLNLAYIMGYYDGDGSEKSPEICSGSRKFLLELKRKYKIKSKIKYKKNHIGSVYRLYLGIEFVRKIMKNYKYSLPRKRKLITNEQMKIKCTQCENLKYKKSKNCENCLENSRIKLDRDLIKILLKSKESLTSIAKKFKMSDNGMKKRLKKMKLYNNSFNSHKYRLKVKEKIIKLYKKQNSNKVISNIMNMSESSISKIILKHKKEQGGYIPSKKIYNYQLILNEYKNNQNFSQIAKKLGMYRSTVRRIILKMQ